MNLPKLTDLKVLGKKVLLRADLDVSLEKGNDEFRLKTIVSTVNYLSENKAKIIIIGHKGRPKGRVTKEFSLAPVAQGLERILGKRVEFIYDISGQEAKDTANAMKEGCLIMLENLRFDKREVGNSESFLTSLSEIGDLYVNEAFGVSHRKHTSIIGLPKKLPHAAGFHFEKEVENLSKVFEQPRRPVVVVMGGKKQDKLDYLEDFGEFADSILVGGRLPVYLDDDFGQEKVTVARLIADREDLTINSIEKFEEEIKKAGTVILVGPMGKYEEEGHGQGTKRVFGVVANSSSFKIAGGGDTHDAILKFGIENKFDWVSVGGGAALQFLAKKTLPGIDALLN